MPGTKDHFPKILIVDDDESSRVLLTEILGEDRYRIVHAKDGEEAIELLENGEVDLVLSDVMMPSLNGFGLLRELRKRARTKTMPVILMSARGGEESTVEGLDAGADDYVAKPFSARELLARVRTHLELSRVRRDWASELEHANKELEAFSYSVSHDLREPLRAVDGFSKLLLDEYGEKLDEHASHYLNRIHAGTQKMSALIDDLLNFSRITRAPLRKESINLTKLARGVIDELQEKEPSRKVAVEIASGLAVHGDAHLIAILLVNLLGNAWKYTSKQPEAQIAFGQQYKGNETIFFIRDNGAGFDMACADRLFVPFQRLHLDSDFEGTGIGLATVQRIISRHGGRIWTEATVGKGATFFFTFGGAR